MIRLAANRSSRFVLALAVIFCLVYGPVSSLNPGRAESYSPAKPSRDVQPITKPHILRQSAVLDPHGLRHLFAVEGRYRG